MAERLVEAGMARRAATGETRSGDVGVIALHGGGALVAAVDALGHGPAAADAADVAAAALRAAPHGAPDALVRCCDDALRGTRGAAVSVAWFSAEESTVTWLGVGNVAGRLLRSAAGGAAAVATLAPAAGTVGGDLPRLAPETVGVRRGDTIVLATDGVRRDFADALELVGPAQGLAERILEHYGRTDDDRLVVVARLLGAAA